MLKFVVIFLAFGALVRASCVFDGSESCSQTATVPLNSANNYIDIRVVGSAGAYLNYSISVSGCPNPTECIVDVLLLSDVEALKFIGTRQLPSPAGVGSAYRTRSTAFGVFFVQSDNWHIIVSNSNSQLNPDITYTVIYDEGEDYRCWTLFTAPIILLVCIAIFILGCRRPLLRLCPKIHERTHGALAPGGHISFGSDEEAARHSINSQRLPRTSVDHTRRCKWPCKCPTTRLFNKPVVGPALFIARNHDIIWPYFPYDDEILPFALRMSCVVASLLFQLLVQTVWSSWFMHAQVVVLVAQVGSLFASSFGQLLAKVTVAAILSAIFAILLPPLVRWMYKPTWANAQERWRRVAGIVLNSTVFLAMVFLAGLFLFFALRLLTIYSCYDLAVSQIMPFILTVLIKSVVPGVPIILLAYFVQMTCGNDPRPWSLDPDTKVAPVEEEQSLMTSPELEPPPFEVDEVAKRIAAATAIGAEDEDVEADDSAISPATPAATHQVTPGSAIRSTMSRTSVLSAVPRLYSPTTPHQSAGFTSPLGSRTAILPPPPRRASMQADDDKAS
eukprot:TRINITY_DN14241_c0_g1_i1.p1 TRINITY_DN14241_c0_g1~~TRINITY_DN14241_c0_g1_i1.p1  ORF type:complete len:560 (+),score=93.87 TRINITY_DN14241_c0_g1_i1:99-1778(+)